MIQFACEAGGVRDASSLVDLIRLAISQVEEATAILAFCSASLSSDIIAKAASEFDVPVASVTTAGHFTGKGRCDDDVVVCAIDGASASSAFAPDIRSNLKRAGRLLTAGFDTAHQEARRLGLAQSITLVFADGLAESAATVVDVVRQGTLPHQAIVGGGAGDGGALSATRVGLGQKMSETGAVALHFFGPQPWGVGLGHGMRPATGKMTVTRAEGSRLFEIDGRPAFAAYESFAASRGLSLPLESAGAFMIQHELGVYFFDELRFARAPLRVLEDGSLVCAAPIASGSSVCILEGDTESMLAAASGAAEEAKLNLRGAPVAGVLVFDCVCRGLLLGDEFQREIDAVKEVFPGVPVAGFLTFGEIARYGGRLQGWHNATAVVVAIPA